MAILGTGKMGAAFAGRLAELEPTLWNRTRSRAEALGVGRVVGTPAAAAASADVVITILTGPEAVRAAYLGPDGALMAARGRVFVEMSTSGPEVLEELEPLVREAGGRLVDAPILGAPGVVLRGGAALLVGGDPTAVELARPVLKRLGEVRWIGALGSGARLKLVSNSMLAVVTVAAAELEAAGEAVGLPKEEVFWTLARLVPALELRRSGYLERRHQPAQFALRDLAKDLGLASRLLQGRAETPISDLVRKLVSQLSPDHLEDDISSVIDLFRQEASQSSPGPNGGQGAKPTA
ncbi:MAG: NAD(P)-dependent oxidoreductase [Candidatus Dormiibacterota bacterium]